MNRPLIAAASIVLLIAGCGGPDKANIAVRKENQSLQKQVEVLQRQHQADQASLKTYEDKNGAPPELSAEKLSELITVADLHISNLTRITPGEIKLYVTPVDAAGDTLKTSGDITVEAFDLSQAEHPLLGTWSITNKDAGPHWLQSIMFHGYAIHCPLSKPVSGDVTVRVTFVDHLTGRKLIAQQVFKASPSTQPS